MAVAEMPHNPHADRQYTGVQYAHLNGNVSYSLSHRQILAHTWITITDKSIERSWPGWRNRNKCRSQEWNIKHPTYLNWRHRSRRLKMEYINQRAQWVIQFTRKTPLRQSVESPQIKRHQEKFLWRSTIRDTQVQGSLWAKQQVVGSKRR